MARARLASRFETLSATLPAAPKSDFSFYRSPFGRGLWRGVNEPTLFDYPADLRPGNPLRGESWLAGDYSLRGGVLRGPGHLPFDMTPPSAALARQPA